jgi:S-methylmethionine-dependent homocysteine/selenocysteine methylase
MARYRNALPQIDDKPFVTDGGLETTLIFHDGVELPYFASIVLMKDAAGHDRLRQYFRRYTDIAAQHGAGFVFESPTWRASADWGEQLGLSARELAKLNRAAIELLARLRDEATDVPGEKVISGCLGPRGDGYNPANRMSVEEAEHYHRQQIDTFHDTDADMVSAFTMNYVEEAIGITRAAQKAGMPVAISFTVETDGSLPTGEPLEAAIASVEAATDRGPAYYMINCAHPTHFLHVLGEGARWHDRIRGVRANSSVRSHAELDEATELDVGNPDELGRQHRTLKQRLANLAVLGGCCGTDHRHVAAICEASFS